MTPQEIHSLVERVLTEEFEIEASRIVPTARLREELGLDSLDGLDLVVALEKEFGCRITEGDVKSIRTVGDVNGMIELRLNEAGSAPA